MCVRGFGNGQVARGEGRVVQLLAALVHIGDGAAQFAGELAKHVAD